MSASTLLASGLLAYASALGFVLLARLTLQGGERGGAKLSFAVFWLFSGMVALAQGTRSLSVVAGLDGFTLMRVLDQTATPAYCLAAAGLLYYVLYLTTGRVGFAIPVGVYYVAMIPMLRFAVETAQPIGYAVGDWQVNLVYATPLGTPYYTMVLALTATPVIVSVVAYALVALRHASDPLRFRAACVALGLALWLTTEVLAWATGAVNTTWGELARRIIGLIVTAVVFTGYTPPAAARRWWGAASISE